MRQPEASAAPQARLASDTFVTPVSPQVGSPARAFLGLAALCAAGVPVVLLLGRFPAPTRAAAGALAVQVLLCLALAWTYRPSPSVGLQVGRTAGVVALGLLTGVSGYFFGPNAGFAGLVAILVALAGTLTGSTTGRFPALTGWLTYLALAGGQALALTLVVTRLIPDHSLTLVIIQPHPMWQHTASHAAVQGVFLAAFLSGRAFQRRYRAVAFEVDAAIRAAARREALLDEARAEYKRALATGRHGVYSGRTLGAYRLGRKLGDDGASEVYEGVHAQGGAHATVRVLRPELAQDPRGVERFLHDTEVAVVAPEDSAAVRAVGGVEQGVPFVAVEDGGAEDFETVLRERGRFSIDDLMRLLDHVGGALERLHAKGSAYLDVNPRNIVRARRPDADWQLVDPGVAQLRTTLATDAERIAMLRYLAPERLRGDLADAHADVYGLSASAYAALTGCDPFGEVRAAVLPDTVATALPLAPSRLADVSANVEAVLLVGLAKNAADRYGSITELRAALTAALAGGLDETTRERARTLGRRVTWGAPLAATDLAAADGVPASADLDPEEITPSARADAVASRPEEDAATPVTRASGPAAAPAWDADDDARDALFGGAVPPLIVTEEVRLSSPAAMPTASLRLVPPAEAWQSAYRSKMRGYYVGMTLLCAGGALLLGAIAREPAPLRVAWACMAGIVAVAWLHRSVSQRWPEESAYRLWAVIGALSVGPAWSLGLHSAFGAVIAAWLFTGGIFQAAHGQAWVERRYPVLVAVIASHTLAFLLVLLGAVRDQGNVAVLQAGAAPWQTVIVHLLLMGAYCASFVAGSTIDRGFDRLTRRAQAAVREAVRQEALLATARVELDLVLEEEHSGIFSGLRLGSYELGRVLGRGGMGEVYEATDGASGRRVALKLVRADRVAEPLNLQIFLEEADALSRVHSPYVARVLEVAGIEREYPYIAMEYIVGRSLAERFRERPSLPLDEVCALVRDVARGLHDVHGAGLVHCDLKPHNLIQTEGARWKVVDFGGAQRLRAVRADSDTFIVIGTPLYMAPEQALGAAVDARTDLYSLCVVIYRALTGRVPFLGRTPSEIARAALRSGPPDPRAFVELPDDVVLTLRLGLAASAEDRFRTALELGLAFDRALDGALSGEHRRRARDLLRREPWTTLPGSVTG